MEFMESTSNAQPQQTGDLLLEILGRLTVNATEMTALLAALEKRQASFGEAM